MFSFNMFGLPEANAGAGGPFSVIYEAYSVSMMPNGEEKIKRHDADNGGKIFLPPTALQHLTRLNTIYPMLFRLTNLRTGRFTHCGVLEFEADEGKCYLPYWMMRNLLCEEGMDLRVESATLPVATFALFQPQTSEFSEITDQRAMLEQTLRSFACLTTGDMIGIRYNDKLYELQVLETRPADAVTVIECDLHTEFAPPADYVPESKSSKKSGISQGDEDDMEESHYTPQIQVPSFVPFNGSGNRLDGKVPAPHHYSHHQNPGAAVATAASPSSSSAHPSPTPGAPTPKRGIPDYNYEIGTINFVRNIKSLLQLNNGIGVTGGSGTDGPDGPGTSSGTSNSGNGNVITPFAGPGVSLRSPKSEAGAGGPPAHKSKGTKV